MPLLCIDILAAQTPHKVQKRGSPLFLALNRLQQLNPSVFGLFWVFLGSGTNYILFYIL